MRWGPEEFPIQGCAAIVTSRPITCTQPSLGAWLGHNISRDFHRDAARWNHTNTSCRILGTTTTLRTQIEAVPCTDTLLTASEPRQEMKQRLRPRPTDSYTNILHGVTVTNRHRVHAQGLTRHSPTQTHTTHGDLTRQDLADRQAVVPTRPDICRPHTLRPGESHTALRTVADPSYLDSLSHPGSQTESPAHPDTPPGPWPSHAQLAPRPRTSPGRTPGRALPRSPSPGHALGPHPAHPPGRRGQGKPRAQHLPGRGGGSCPAPPGTWPRGKAGPGPQPDAGAGPGVRGAPLPSPASAGRPGGEGSRWGEPGFRLEPRLPVLPPRGRKQGRGRPAQAFLPPPSDRPGTWDGVSVRGRKGGARWGEGEKAPFPLDLWTSSALVSFVFLM